MVVVALGDGEVGETESADEFKPIVTLEVGDRAVSGSGGEDEEVFAPAAVNGVVTVTCIYEVVAFCEVDDVVSAAREDVVAAAATAVDECRCRCLQGWCWCLLRRRFGFAVSLEG